MIQSFLTPFLTIILAEMLDKSQLALISLSSKHKHIFSLFLGSILAFALVDGLAVIFGAVISSVIPHNIVKIIAGIVFIIFGLLTFKPEKREREEKKPISTKHIFGNAFVLVFLSEWADKTQLATAAFATQYNPFLVFIGVMSAMGLLSLLAIFLGTLLAKKINKSVLQKVSGIAFIGIGIYLFIS